jgi:hypothetical protein
VPSASEIGSAACLFRAAEEKIDTAEEVFGTAERVSGCAEKKIGIAEKKIEIAEKNFGLAVETANGRPLKEPVAGEKAADEV